MEAYVCLDEVGNVVSLFNYPQNEPKPEGYAVVSAADPRIEEFKSLISEYKTPIA